MTTEELKQENERLREDLKTLKTDLKTAIDIIKTNMGNLGIDLQKKNSIISALPTIAMKATTGMLKIDRIDEITELFKKYKNDFE